MGCGCNKNKGRKPQQMATSKGFTNPNKVEPVKEQPSKEGPSLLQKALNFGEAIVDHVADGLTKVDKNVRECPNTFGTMYHNCQNIYIVGICQKAHLHIRLAASSLQLLLPEKLS